MCCPNGITIHKVLPYFIMKHKICPVHDCTLDIRFMNVVLLLSGLMYLYGVVEAHALV